MKQAHICYRLHEKHSKTCENLIGEVEHVRMQKGLLKLLTRVLKVGVGRGVVLIVIVFSEPVLVPVADQALSVVRILVHGLCRMYEVI